MTTTSLSIERFQKLLDQFGGNLASWPNRDQAAAISLLSTSPEAQQCLVAARELDAMLAAHPKAPPGLADRIMAASGALDPAPAGKAKQSGR